MGKHRANSKLAGEVAEREQLAARLRESEARCSVMFHRGPIGMGMSRLSDDHFVDVNDAFLKIFGLTRKEVLEHTALELGIWVDPHERQRMITTIRKKGYVNMLEGTFRKKSGQVGTLLMTAEIIMLNGQEVLLGYLLDITERKRAEMALKENEDRLSFALDSTHIGNWELDLADHTARRSIEHDRIFGYKKLLPSWTYETFLKHVVPEDRALIKTTFQKAVKTLSDWNLEFRIRRVDGEVRWVWGAARHRAGAYGSRGRMTGIVQDITERKLAEKRLRESEERFRQLLDKAPVAISINREGKRTYVNHMFLKLFGFKRAEEVVGHRVPERWAPESRGIIEEDLRKRRNGEKTPREYEGMVALRKDGSTFDAHIVVDPVDLPDGQAYMSFVLDISDRKKAERALQESERLYRGLVEDQTEFIVRWLPGGKRVFCNKSYRDYFGIKDLASLTASFLELVHVEDRQSVVDKIKTITPNNPVAKNEHRVYRADGSIGWNQWVDRGFFDENGKILHYQSAGRDITDLKKAEEELRQKNIALGEVIKQIEFEKDRVKKEIALNVEELLIPTLRKLHHKGPSTGYVKMLEHNLKELTSSFGIKITDKKVNLSPKEIDISNMVKSGLSTKEISELLNVSSLTVSKHRRNIRQKLGISNKDVNLTSFLRRT